MKIDLCKLFGVAEGEEFKFEGYEYTYIIKKQFLYILNEDRYSHLEVNDLINKEIIKLPKKKKFSDDELCILRNIDKKYKWIARDESGSLCIFDEKPKKSEEMWDNVTHSDFIELNCYNHLFNSIQWEDEEPICIDEYVQRQVSQMSIVLSGICPKCKANCTDWLNKKCPNCGYIGLPINDE